ncbi:DUF402 domain-containing protein [Deinococcus sp. QL22]|uniref:DUF402 domain-containing protein n=1 Tax=Deinococcus sp. QL22 TaxID=2939437 RepID=UPI002017323F|nr:DUF402 domain-containing protein [Deinococcus sp. QL22]UQN10616.1 DUF402 domain-containing protein [Deinococcus sp. QL22]
MHPVRIESLDIHALTHTLDHGPGEAPVTYPVLWAQETSYGLHMARAFVGHPKIHFIERHVIPALGLLVNRFSGTDWITQNSYYVDIASISTTGSCWVTRDLYLDLSIRLDGTPTVLDTDEYLTALREGLLKPDEAAWSLTCLHQVVNGVLAHRDLEVWLRTQGVELSWRGAPSLTSAATP